MSGNGSKRRNIRNLFLAGSHALLAVFYAARQISRFSIVSVGSSRPHGDADKILD